MSKPGTLPGKVRRPTIETQTQIAHAEVKLRLYHLGQPWACGIGLLLLAILVRRFAAGSGTAALVAACGFLTAFFDWRLRSSRIHWEARVIGPVTILGATSWLAYAIMYGFSKTLFLLWLFVVWILASVIWDIWMSSGEHKDENRQFPVAAASAGLGGSWLSNLKRNRDKGAGRENLTATMHLPPGEITPANAAAKVDNLEGSMGLAAGSLTLAPDPSHAANTLMKICDPQILDKEPLPWPFGMEGSNPGASIAEPIQLGLWQDGQIMEYTLLRHHLLIVGKTDAGKTLTAAYNIIGESITRRDYACFSFDIAKQNQFLGAMRPALHQIAITPEEALKLLDAIHRIRPARAAYLASKHQTEWSPGCGLTLLNFWIEEVADLADMIVNKSFGGSKERLEQWKSDLRVMRSLGGRFDMSTVRPDFQEVPTMLRSQMFNMCFGVDNAAEAALGLSEEQQKRGCRPQLWGTRVPGKFHIDAPSIPDDRIGMPARGWYWGPDSTLMAAYAAQHPWQDRPLDDVTGEALEAVPSPAASTAFAVKSAATASTARPNLHVVPGGYRPPKLSPQQTLDILNDELKRRRAEWNSPREQLIQQSDLDGVGEYMDRSRQHIGNLLRKLAEDPVNLLVKRDDLRGGKWQILPEPMQQEAEE